MTNIWCKKLRPLEILFFIGRSLFSPVIIHYDEYLAIPLAVKILVLAQRCGLCRNFYPAKLDYDTKDDDGYSLSYRINEQLRICCEHFLAQHAPFVDERYRQMVKTHMRVHLTGQIIFVEYSKVRIRDIGSENNIIVVEPNPLNTTLADFYAAQGLSVKSVLNFPKVLREAWVVPLALAAICLAAKSWRGKAMNNIDCIRPKIWVEYHDNHFIMNESWRQYLKSNDFDQVYYFDRNDSPILETRIAALEKQGLKWIDLQRPTLLKLGRIPIRRLAGMLAECLSFVGPHPLWFKALRFQERLWYHSYLTVFKKFQVKLLIQHQDRDWKQAVQAHAIEDAGGIMVGFHYSNIPPRRGDTFFLNSQQVIFVWGKGQYLSIQDKGHTAKYILPSGFWFKPAYDGRPPPELDGLDKKLEFVMTVFDADVAHSCLLYPNQTPELMSAFLMCILDNLENNPRWGALLKFKFVKLDHYRSSIPFGGQIVERFSRLMEQKRVIELNFRVSPVAAAANSNLAVCFVINSAGVISGLFGHKAIHWDCSSSRDPVYDDPGQKIFFRKLTDFSHAIECAAGGDKSVGDFSKWAQYQNYFSDFRGDQRIAMFIQNYMDEMIATCDPERSLVSAVKHYRDSNQLPCDTFENILLPTKTRNMA